MDDRLVVQLSKHAHNTPQLLQTCWHMCRVPKHLPRHFPGDDINASTACTLNHVRCTHSAADPRTAPQASQVTCRRLGGL